MTKKDEMWKIEWRFQIYNFFSIENVINYRKFEFF